MKVTRELELVLMDVLRNVLRIDVHANDNTINPSFTIEGKSIEQTIREIQDFGNCYLQFWEREGLRYYRKGFAQIKDGNIVTSNITNKVINRPSIHATLYPDLAYSPDSFKRILDVTGIEGQEFQQEFELDAETYNEFMQGAETIKWNKWKDLQSRVIPYIRKAPALSLVQPK